MDASVADNICLQVNEVDVVCLLGVHEKVAENDEWK